ncbi:hypothetical protein [Glycomyces tarimensis]
MSAHADASHPDLKYCCADGGVLMAGAEVFAMEPDKVHDAVAALFGVEEAIRTASDALEGECGATTETLIAGQCAIGEALAGAADFWCGVQAAGIAGLVGNLGEYLATCAEQAVEIDDYNAADFASYADHDRYPDRASQNASARPDW